MWGSLKRLWLGVAAAYLVACGPALAHGDPITLYYSTPEETLPTGGIGDGSANNPYPTLTATFTQVGTYSATGSDTVQLVIAATGTWIDGAALQQIGFNIANNGPSISIEAADGSSLETEAEIRNNSNLPTGPAVYVSAISATTIANTATQTIGIDAAGDLTFSLLWSAANSFTAGDSATFNFVSTDLSPSSFLYTSTGEPPPPNENQVFSVAAIYGSSNGSTVGNYDPGTTSINGNLDTPEPSRVVGMLGMAIMGATGLCFGFARKRKPAIC